MSKKDEIGRRAVQEAPSPMFPSSITEIRFMPDHCERVNAVGVHVSMILIRHVHSGIVICSAPAKPTNLTIIDRTTSSITFRWNQTGPNITSCNVTVNSTLWNNATCNSSASTCTISTLPVAGQDYNITLTVFIGNQSNSSDLQQWKTRKSAKNVTLAFYRGSSRTCWDLASVLGI